MAQQLILKRVSRAGASGEWNKADYDVVADGIVVVVKAAAVPVGMSWMWTLGFGHHEESSADAWLRGKSDQPWPRADSASKVKLILETPSQELRAPDLRSRCRTLGFPHIPGPRNPVPAILKSAAGFLSGPCARVSTDRSVYDKPTLGV